MPFCMLLIMSHFINSLNLLSKFTEFTDQIH